MFLAPPKKDKWRRARKKMVQGQIRARGVNDPLVLEAMAKVPRHRFVPEDLLHLAYDDGPLPIGEGQTISQPYIVALMTHLLELRPDDVVLEIGTGCGYQTAVLAQLVRRVESVEIIPSLHQRAHETLRSLEIENVNLHLGDGWRGWPTGAPYDAILLTASPPQLPSLLPQQLIEGGRLVAPIGRVSQHLKRFTLSGKALLEEQILPVRFVPMTGSLGREEEDLEIL